MRTIDITLVDVPERRQRKEINKVKLGELKADILDNVLLHAPVVQASGERFILVAGERRFRAIQLISAEKREFTYNKLLFAPGTMPVVEIDESFDLIRRNQIELSENVIRDELPWQDRVAALAYIHELKVAANPAQTVIATAQELIADVGGTQTGASSVSHVRAQIAQANVVARHLDDPAIANARNATEAFNLVIQRETRAFEAELVKRRQAIVGTSASLIEVRKGSCFDILPKLESSIFDTILGDPPYGINVNTGGFRSRTVQHHNYDDSPDAARTILQCIVTEGFRVTKPRANLFLFIDIDYFVWLKDVCLRAGWEPFRTPIVWGKSDSEGMAPWGREGFRRTTEYLLFARKGQKGLYHSPIDYLRHNRVARNEREYGPEKPTSLLRELLSASTLPGDYVLDPCCGSGSTLVAARSLKMKSLGIEVDEAAYNLALAKSAEPAPTTTDYGLDGDNLGAL